MEPANKPPVKPARRNNEATEIEFLPDADAIERTPLPRYVRLTLHVLALSLVSFILWATFSQVEKVVTAHGRLVNPLPNIVLQPLETSIVQRIEVRAGQVVKKGQLLATLDPTFAQADETQLRNRLTSLSTQTEGLRAELDGKSAAPGDDKLQQQLSSERQANYQAQKLRIDEGIARLKAGIETNRHDQQVLSQRVKSLGEIEAMQEKLISENFGARMHLLEARDRRLAAEREMIGARNREIELQRELSAAEAERVAFDKSWRQRAMEDLLAASRDRDSVSEQLAKADKRRQLVQMVAPADAVVLEVGRLSPGTVVKEAEPMFTLVPLGAELEAEVQVDSIDIGYIKKGDPVHLKLDAFPFQKHGAIDGKLSNISEDAFRREQVRPGEGTDAYYLGRVAFGKAMPRKMAPGARLLPGMTVTAEIVVGKRSVMSYLLWPLTKAMDESIREP